MNVTELQIVSFTLGYMPKHKRVQKMCGTFQAARYLRNRGMTLQQSLALLNR